MIKARVHVVSARPGQAWVASSEAVGCAACQAASSCGISGLGRYFSRRAPLLAIPREAASPGEELILRIDEADLLKAGFLAYLLPALLAALAAALAGAAGAGDGYAALAALAGFACGLLLARLGRPAPLLITPPGAPHD